MPHTPTHVDPSIVNLGALSPLPLRTGEEVLFNSRFHIVILVFRLVIVAAIAAGLWFLLQRVGLGDFLPPDIERIARFIPWVLGGFLGLIFILNYFVTRFLLTTARAQARTGVISFAELNIPLAQVDNVQTHIGLVGLLLNYGTIRLASGNSILVVTFAGIPNAKRRGDQIEDLVARARGWA